MLESSDDAAWKPHIAELEKSILQLMNQTRVPGLSIAIVKEARIVWRRGFGVKDRASGAPVDDDTIFEAASMSKPVFAYVVMKLCEKGVMNLDTPLTHYTPDPFLDGDSRLELITARHVLSHTTGFPNWRSTDQPLKISFTPGEKWSYSGEGYYYLQTVVTHLTGHTDLRNCEQYEAGLKVYATDFDPYMKRNLLAPFGMVSSGYVWNESFGKDAARPHDPTGKPLESRPPSAPAVARYGAAGGLLTTATDYAKFLCEVINPPVQDEFHLTGASLAEMTRPQVKVEDGDGYSVWWGLGWRIVHAKGGDFIGHGGENPGFQSTAEVSLKDRLGFVILTNGDNGAQLLEKLAPDVSSRLHGV